MANTFPGAFPRIPKITVLSPDAAFVALFSQAFAPEEAEVTVWPRGRGALEHLFLDPPDLLVVDQALSDISGLELVGMWPKRIWPWDTASLPRLLSSPRNLIWRTGRRPGCCDVRRTIRCATPAWSRWKRPADWSFAGAVSPRGRGIRSGPIWLRQGIRWLAIRCTAGAKGSGFFCTAPSLRRRF